MVIQACSRRVIRRRWGQKGEGTDDRAYSRLSRKLGADSTAYIQALLSDSDAPSPLSFVYPCNSSARPTQPSIPPGSVNEYQLQLGRQRMNAGVQVKLWDPLRTRAIPERLRGVFATRHYTNPRLPLPLPYQASVGHPPIYYWHSDVSSLPNLFLTRNLILNSYHHHLRCVCLSEDNFWKRWHTKFMSLITSEHTGSSSYMKVIGSRSHEQKAFYHPATPTLKWEHGYNFPDSERIASLRGGRQTRRWDTEGLVA